MAGLTELLVLVEGRIDPEAVDSARDFERVNEHELSLWALVDALLGDPHIDLEIARNLLSVADGLGMTDDEDIVEFRDWIGWRTERTDGLGALRRTALHYAALEGDVDVARRLLADAADPTSADANGDTPLHLAVRGGSVAVVELLLEHGAEVDAVAGDGRTALHHAVPRGTDVIRVLLAHGADPQFGLARQQTPLGLARMGGAHEAVELLEGSLAARQQARR